MLPEGVRVEVARPASIASVAAAVTSTPIPHLPYPPPSRFEFSRESLSARLGGELTREVLPWEPHGLISGHSESVCPPFASPCQGCVEPGGRGQRGSGPWRMDTLPFPDCPGPPCRSFGRLVLNPPSFPHRGARWLFLGSPGPTTSLELGQRLSLYTSQKTRPKPRDL